MSRHRFGRVGPIEAALGLALWIPACEDDATAPRPEPRTENPVRFAALAVGQESRYLLFACDRYGQPDIATSTYLADTLVVAVTAQDTLGFQISEFLTPGSVSRHGAMHVPDPDAVYSYHLQVVADSVQVTKPAGTGWYEGSRLFIAPTDRFALAPIAAPVTTFTGWQPAIPYHETLAVARVAQHQQFGVQFDGLNVVQDNRLMQTDGPGYVFGYAADHGLVRWSTYSWWTRAGNGWDRLP